MGFSIVGAMISEQAVEVDGHAVENDCDFQDLNRTKCQGIFLNCNNMGNEKTIQFVKAIKSNRTLTYLYLGQNHIGDRACNVLANILLNRGSNLKYLYLGDNVIGDDGARSIAQALTGNKSLVELNLWNNNIGSDGGSALAHALEKNDSLNHFDLGKNNLGDYGIKRFGEAIAVNTGLICANVSFNSFRDEAAFALAIGIEQNKTLTKITTNGNSFRPELGARIKRALRKNDEFQKNSFRDVLLDPRGKEKWIRSRLFVVGRTGAGKTTIIKSLLKENFVTTVSPTRGVKIRQIRTKAMRKDWVEDVDTSRQKHKYSMKLAAKSTVERIIKTPKSFENCVDSRETSLESKGSLGHSQEQREMIERLLAQYDQDLLVDARKERNALTLSVWDFSGHQSFFSLYHSLFIDFGMYLIAFNLKELLDNEDCEIKHLQFWIDSLSYYATQVPLILVGTFLDRIGTTTDIPLIEIQSILSTKLDVSNIKGFRGNGNLLFFPVDNTNFEGIDTIRQVIDECLGVQSGIHRPVPFRWINVLDMIDEIEDGNKPWISLKKTKEICRLVGISSDEEIFELLKFFHNQGVLFYFDRCQSMNEIVFLKPQWLMDVVSKIIMPAKVCSITVEDELGHEKDLFSNGLVSSVWLRRLCGKKDAEVIERFMKSIFLLCMIPSPSKNELHLIASFAAPNPEKLSRNSKPARRLRILLQEQRIPLCFYSQFLCLLLEHKLSTISSKPPEVSDDSCTVFLADDRNLIVNYNSVQRYILLTINGEQIAQEALGITMEIMKKLMIEKGQDKSDWQVQVSDVASHTFQDYDEAAKSRIHPWFN